VLDPTEEACELQSGARRTEPHRDRKLSAAEAMDGSFEHAKSEMEIALGKHIEGLLREAQQSSKKQAA